jgi:hypothetical protein
MASRTSKIIQVARIFIKTGVSAGTTIYKFYTLKGDDSRDDYLVTLNVNGKHTCTCGQFVNRHVTCKHITFFLQVEASRTRKLATPPTFVNLDELTVEQIAIIRKEGEAKQKQLKKEYRKWYNSRLAELKVDALIAAA